MAIAGTYTSSSSSLFKDQKETKEQHFVLQGIKESLQDLVRWRKEISYERHFYELKHLCTELEGELKDFFDPSMICDKLHPTAALGGYPTKKVFHWLSQLPSQEQRGFFGAPFGFFDGVDQFFCIVSIRGLQWDLKRIQVSSGCGVIAESSLQKEWRELFLKREQVKKLFQ